MMRGARSLGAVTCTTAIDHIWRGVTPRIATVRVRPSLANGPVLNQCASPAPQEIGERPRP